MPREASRISASPDTAGQRERTCSAVSDAFGPRKSSDYESIQVPVAPLPRSQKMEYHVHVVARFRPPVTLEEEEDSRGFLIHPSGRSVDSADHAYHFELDRAFGENTSQEDVYDYVGRPVVCDVLDGYNGTIFAYGQTGSGKTYCMFGPSNPRPELVGIMPRTAEQVFETISNSADDSTEFTLRCSFLEVYREQMRDLLDPDNQGLKVKELPQRGLYVHGLTREYVTCAAEVMEVLRTGNRARSVARTCLNEHSSRSHAIFMMQVEQRSSEGTERLGKLTLVDLAGSEKVGKSGCVGETLEEAKKINWSLSALGKVIDALAEQRPHVPYRDSRLTRVLEEALGGNCRTTLLVAASPFSQCADETLSSLRFATRAKAVRNHAKVNYMYSSDQLLVLVGQLQRELASANKQIAHFGSLPDGRREQGDASEGEKVKGKRLRVPLEKISDKLAHRPRSASRTPKERDEEMSGLRSPSGATSCGSLRSLGSSPLSESFEELALETIAPCIDDETWRPLAIAARDAMTSLEAALLAQERALEEAGLLRSDAGERSATGRSTTAAPSEASVAQSGVGGRTPGGMSRRSYSSSGFCDTAPHEGGQPLDTSTLSERWRALRHAVDARSLHWRLQVERHKNETLSLELEMRKRHTQELEKHKEKLHGRMAMALQAGTFDGKAEDIDDSLFRLLSRARGSGGSSSSRAPGTSRCRVRSTEGSAQNSARHPRITRPVPRCGFSARGRELYGTVKEALRDISCSSFGNSNAVQAASADSSPIRRLSQHSHDRLCSDRGEAFSETPLVEDGLRLRNSSLHEDVLPMAGTGEAVSNPVNDLVVPPDGLSRCPEWSAQFEKYMASTKTRLEELQLSQDSLQAQVGELQTDLEARSHQMAELAAELGARDVRISALRHEVRIRDALLSHLREDSLIKAEQKDVEVERLVEQAMLPLTSILSSRQAATAAAACERSVLAH